MSNKTRTYICIHFLCISNLTLFLFLLFILNKLQITWIQPTIYIFIYIFIHPEGSNTTVQRTQKGKRRQKNDIIYLFIVIFFSANLLVLYARQ